MKVTVDLVLEFDVDEQGRTVDEIVATLAQHVVSAKMSMYDLDKGFCWHDRYVKKVTPEIEMEVFP